MKKRLLFLLLGLLLLFGTLEALHYAYRRAALRMQPTLAEEVQAIAARYDEQPAVEDATLFVGSSSIRRWSSLVEDMQPLVALNHGFGGSELSHIIEYRRSLIDPFRAESLVIYSGDNDLSESSPKTPASVTADYKLLVEGLLTDFPSLDVYCLSIKASPGRLDRWPLMKEVNQAMQAWCSAQERVHFLDVASLLLDERGLPAARWYVEDGIHLNAAGYARWRELIRTRLLADRAEREGS